MNPVAGWGLAAAGVALAWGQDGLRGVLLAASVIVFWLLLHFSRALRVMRMAAQRPVGRVDSAVMLNARLRPGMTLMQVIPHTRSLGQRIGEGSDPERWRWADAGGAAVTLELRRGRLAAWALQRPREGQTGTGVESGAAGVPAGGADGADRTDGADRVAGPAEGAGADRSR